MPDRDEEEESKPSYFLEGIYINGVPVWEAQSDPEKMAFPFTAREVHGEEIEAKINEIGPEEDDTVTLSFTTIDFDEEGNVIRGRSETEFDWGEDWDLDDFWADFFDALREELGYDED